ncbi:MAG: cytochrome C, partial [Acidobacteria bacterium]
GVGCNTCHGQVDRMPLMYQYASLQMEWCLNCHRAPEKYLRPRDQVFNMRYEEPSSDKPETVDGRDYIDQLSLGRDLRNKYKLRTERDITSCSTCHR